ncbi:MAG TPA: disulfide bond formation protein B, partial [Methylophaga sp.]|nr:disulfide bond formation protein B [Methylophaga sp.]
HVWLQSLPADQVPSCGPGMGFIMENFPLTDALSMVLSGSGECAEISWTFLTLSIPAWTLLTFVGMLGLAIAAAWRQH